MIWYNKNMDAIKKKTSGVPLKTVVWDRVSNRKKTFDSRIAAAKYIGVRPEHMIRCLYQGKMISERYKVSSAEKH